MRHRLVLLSFGLLFLSVLRIVGQITPQPEAFIFAELETISTRALRNKLNEFVSQVSSNPSSQGYIINYGTRRAIGARELLIRRSHDWRCGFDGCRITFIRGQRRERPKTVLWIIPEGAKIPKP